MANEEKNETYVTDLAGPGDRWLSVTDAARITRRQEKTIRDWIEAGRLPVHPVRVGLNKRTRQVRLSDLETLTPIIDPEAGITTDLGLLDLPSIPRAQQQLMEQMAALREQIGSLSGQYNQFVTETRQIWDVHQTQYQALDRRDEDLQRSIQQAHENWTATLQEVSQDLRRLMTATTEQHQHMVERLHSDLGSQISTLQHSLVLIENDHHQQGDTLHEEIHVLDLRQQRALAEAQASTAAHIQDLHGLLELQQTALQDEHQKWETALARQAEEQAQAQTHLHQAVIRDLNTAVQRLHEHIDALIEQQARERDDAIEDLNREIAADLAAMSTRIDAIDTQLERITTQVEAGKIIALGSQRRADSQDQKIADLQAQLRQESEARLALAQQVAALLATKPVPKSRK